MAFEDWIASHARIDGKSHRKVRLDDTMGFFQQLSTLVSSGTPLMRSLEVATEQCRSRRLQEALQQICSMVASGSSFHSAAARFPQIFLYEWVEVIRCGELTGKMGQVLLELNSRIVESQQTTRKIKAALMYPVILLIVAVVAVVLMLWLVVPTFAQMFQDMGAKLPEVTQFVISGSGFVVSNGVYILITAIVTGLALRKMARSDPGRRFIEGWALVTPSVGEAVVQLSMYKFSSTLSLLLKSGVPLLDALGTLQRVFLRHPMYHAAIEHACSRVAAGRPLGASLEETRLFPSMVTNMVLVGEQSGRLAEVMEQIAPYYREKSQQRILAVTKLLEPLIIMGMGGAIAGMMLAIYMPMFEISGNVH